MILYVPTSIPSVTVKILANDTGRGVTGLNASTFPALTVAIYVDTGFLDTVFNPTLTDIGVNDAYTAWGLAEIGDGSYRLDLVGDTDYGQFTRGGRVDISGDDGTNTVVCPTVDCLEKPGTPQTLTSDYDPAKTALQAGGSVTVGNVTVGGYAANMSPGSQVLTNTANKLSCSNGNVLLANGDHGGGFATLRLATLTVNSAAPTWPSGTLASTTNITAAAGVALTSAYDAAKTAATATAVAGIVTILSGITSLAKWLRASFRSDTADATALSEINSSGGTFAPATMSQQGIAANEGGGGGGGSGLTGPCTFTFHTQDADGGTVTGAISTLRAAGVGAVQGYIQSTDGNGNATFNYQAGTYSLCVGSAAGITFAPATIILSLTPGSQIIVGSSPVLIVTPTDPDLCTVYFKAIHAGLALAGATFIFTQISAPSGSGINFVKNVIQAVSDSGGIVQPQLYQGCRWECHPPYGGSFYIDVPTESTYPVPDVVTP